MNNLINHLAAALEIVKSARTRVEYNNTSSAHAMGDFPTTTNNKEGTTTKSRFQTDLDRDFNNFDVPTPDSNNDSTASGSAYSTFTRLTPDEGELFSDLSLRDKFQLNSIKNEAYAEASEQFPNTFSSQEDGPGDAFRHAYASALLAREIDPDFAKEFTDAHEAIPSGNDKGKAFMDLYNNQKGIEIALANPDSTDAELAELIKEDIKKGEMVILEEGKPVFSSNYYGEYGGTPTVAAEPRPPVVTEHKSSVDEKEEEQQRGTMDISSPGGTPGGLGQVHG